MLILLITLIKSFKFVLIITNLCWCVFLSKYNTLYHRKSRKQTYKESIFAFFLPYFQITRNFIAIKAFTLGFLVFTT